MRRFGYAVGYLGMVAFFSGMAFLLAGCSTTQEQQSEVIEQAVILLEHHSHPELPKFEAGRVQFLSDAQKYRPKTNPSPASSPTLTGGK